MTYRVHTLTLLMIIACKTGDEPEVTSNESKIATLEVTQHLTRASLAIRGIRPTIDELNRVESNSDALSEVVDEYLDSNEFLLTVADIHAEHLLTRTEQLRLPAYGPLQGLDLDEIHKTLAESTLELAKYIVENESPYTDLVTADYFMGNRLGSEIFGYSLNAGDDWQPVSWDATRETAGLLTDPSIWFRYPSNGANNHRQRAEFIADALLCSSFLTRDISISGGIDLADAEAVAQAVNAQTECVGCHQGLDPLAANLWGIRESLNEMRIRRAYESGCEGNEVYNCYPLTTYNPYIENEWEARGLRPPGYYGVETTGLRTLGQQIAEDPRFHQCTARKTYSYLAQVSRDEIPFEFVVKLTESFEQADWNYKALVRAIVLSPEFAAAPSEVAKGEPHLASLQVLRPAQLNRSVAALTGFEWKANVDRDGCGAGSECWGEQNLLLGDNFGFRMMAGGTEGYAVTTPTHTSTPVRSMIIEAFATEAAAYAVDSALFEDDSRLFNRVEDDSAGEADIRMQLAEFHHKFWAESVDPNSPEVDETFGLFSTLVKNTGDPRAAWILTLSAFIQDTKFLHY